MHLQAMTGAGKSYFLYFSQMVFDVVADYAEQSFIIAFQHNPQKLGEVCDYVDNLYSIHNTYVGNMQITFITINMFSMKLPTKQHPTSLEVRHNFVHWNKDSLPLSQLSRP